MLDLQPFSVFVKFPILFLVFGEDLPLNTREFKDPFALTLFGPVFLDDWVVVFTVRALRIEALVSEYFF